MLGNIVDITVVVDIASLFVFIPSGPSKSINHNYTSGAFITCLKIFLSKPSANSARNFFSFISNNEVNGSQSSPDL